MLDLKLPHQHCRCFYLSVVGILRLWLTHIWCLCKLHAKPTKVKINTMQQKTILGGNVAFLHLLNIKNSSKKFSFYWTFIFANWHIPTLKNMKHKDGLVSKLKNKIAKLITLLHN